jgi:hypothetical protein
MRVAKGALLLASIRARERVSFVSPWDRIEIVRGQQLTPKIHPHRRVAGVLVADGRLPVA